MEITAGPINPIILAMPITLALSGLLNGMHLYQHTDVNFDDLLSDLGERDKEATRRMIDSEWAVKDGLDLTDRSKVSLSFGIPLLKAHCSACKQVYPFNPEGSTGRFTFAPTYQVFVLGFQCQGCKRKRVVFMVTRAGDRLVLSGRSEIENMPVPDYIPNGQRRYYSGAVLAFNCNQVLPALFLLRTLIEQHMRAALGEVVDFTIGEELCAAYNVTLDETFKSQFASFADIYGKLSDALHRADENADLFKFELERIESHFDGKRTFERASKVNLEKK